MPQNELSIIILKPTENFLEFITSQFPHMERPSLAGTQHDGTAYSIPKCEDDETILETVEMFYPLMLRHESSRVIGQALSSEVTGSFFDFLCCFKFELHTDVLMMESHVSARDRVLCIKPRSVVVSCAAFSSEQQALNGDKNNMVQMSHFTENTTALVKNFDDVSEIAPFIKHHYRPIVRQEMQRLSEDAQYCPVVNSFKMFSRYFDIELHSQVVHLH